MIETERRFLLSRLPKSEPHQTWTIQQWYIKLEGQWIRIRSAQSETGQIRLTHTRKTRIEVGSSEEIERDISLEEFNEWMGLIQKLPHRRISKIRRIWEDTHIWEIDQFTNGIGLIIAEVEISDLGQYLQIPAYIQPLILEEITGRSGFGNRNLAMKYLNNESKNS